MLPKNRHDEHNKLYVDRGSQPHVVAAHRSAGPSMCAGAVPPSAPYQGADFRYDNVALSGCQNEHNMAIARDV